MNPTHLVCDTLTRPSLPGEAPCPLQLLPVLSLCQRQAQATPVAVDLPRLDVHRSGLVQRFGL